MIARGTDAEVSVIALVGERGREVREFLENDLGPEGLARSVVVVATSDAPPVERLRAAFVATRIAEWFRDSGRDVVLMMDSLTRVAMAQREIGLSAGEPPATRGYPPSVFALLPRLLERAGPGATGSITGLYTVLVEGDDLQDPIGDTARSILDGHVVLTRRLATSGHFPSIDVLESISRVATAVITPEQRRRRDRCAGCWPRTATSRSSSRSAPTPPAADPTPTARSPCCRGSTTSCGSRRASPPRLPRPGGRCTTWWGAHDAAPRADRALNAVRRVRGAPASRTAASAWPRALGRAPPPATPSCRDGRDRRAERDALRRPAASRDFAGRRSARCAGSPSDRRGRARSAGQRASRRRRGRPPLAADRGRQRPRGGAAPGAARRGCAAERARRRGARRARRPRHRPRRPRSREVTS